MTETARSEDLLTGVGLRRSVRRDGALHRRAALGHDPCRQPEHDLADAARPLPGSLGPSAHHLADDQLSDFNGNYVAGTASATVGGGAGAVIMKNQNGVVMKLTGVGQGIQLTLADSGVDVALKN